MLRWIGVHVTQVRAAQNDPEADLKAVASSPQAALTIAVIVAFWVLLVADMVLKPFT